ncbi:MAG: anthranilate phosphoribosyltransferase [Myxococcota bacterium]
MIRSVLERVRQGQCLERSEMRELIHEILRAEPAEEEVGALLLALHTRGETDEEIVGAAEALRELARPLPEAPADAIDTCGTGGDGRGTFNISTVAALVVAGAGIPVAKHGNRAATSRCGSADVLEALGVRLDLSPERMAASVHEVGIGFLFARACHPAMARVASLRRRLQAPTLFNRLGPLTNPMRVRRQLVGVADAAHAPATRQVLRRLGSERVCIVSAEDGLDEASTCSVTRFWSYADGAEGECRLSPGTLLPLAKLEDLRGGDAAESAHLAREVLTGTPGPRRDVVLLNTAAALCVAGRAHDLEQGLGLAAEAIDSGAAEEKLVRWIEFCRDAERSP